MKKLYSILLVLLLCIESTANANCFIAKENNTIIQQEGVCSERYTPGSTFDIAISLMGYHEGVLIDKTHPELLFNESLSTSAWVDTCKQLHNPSTWMKNSCIWYSHIITQTFGIDKFKHYLSKFNYGNQDVYGNNDLANSLLFPFLKISPEEQVIFLEKLVRSELPVSKKAQRFTRSILCVEEFIDGWKLYGKASNSFSPINIDYQVGWFIGWAAKGARKIFFANYIEDEQKINVSAAKRAKEIAKEHLRPLVSEQYNYNNLLKNVPSIFVAPIKELVHKNFSKKEIKNIKFKQLFGGLSRSRLFQVDNNGKKYVLRLLDENKTMETRRSEVNAHKVGSNLKIAPNLIYTDQISLVMLMDFIEGCTMSKKDLNDTLLIHKIVATLKKFHNYEGNGYILNKTKLDTIKEAYKKYTKEGAVYPSEYGKIYQKLQEDFVKLTRPYLPSHGDLNPENILIAKDGHIYLIDWAEARVDNPLLDIGWLACCSGADNHQIKNLLKEYFEREPTIAEFNEVLFFKNVTNLTVATLLIGEQEEKDQSKLDAILNGPIKKSSDYRKEGITKQEISSQKGYVLTVYALSWLKELIGHQ